MDTRRDQIIEIIKKDLIGPDPIDYPGMTQENGEEILTSDPPVVRYIAGILFPQNSLDEQVDTENSTIDDSFYDDAPEIEESYANRGLGKMEYLEDAEELMNLSNAFKQSAISMTVAGKELDTIKISVSAGVYFQGKHVMEDGKERNAYFRKPIHWKSIIPLSSNNSPLQAFPVYEDSEEIGLKFYVTYRYRRGDTYLYTFSLVNEKQTTAGRIKDEDCFFQVEFSVESSEGFLPMPENLKKNLHDKDFLSNQMLYRKVKTYAIGHGCAAEWSEDENCHVTLIRTSIFPQYEIKPILPNQNIKGVKLLMADLSDTKKTTETLAELERLCSEYKEWINELEKKKSEIDDQTTAERHILACKECQKRMEDGVALLKSDGLVLHAFQLMNKAMLLQQLHYNLPLQKWMVDERGRLSLDKQISIIPDINDKNTWYEPDKKTYGQWRPFQLAFILINLRSMCEKSCEERSLVDLIWFPTGGGKTEAYLGLSAYTIFIRRLQNKNDSGTAIIMRYTLRLLTSQQYERASALICACESIRQDNPELLGDSRISIGLWVGDATSPNRMKEAVKEYDSMKNGESDNNPFVVLKCPWCGAQMGIVNKKGSLRDTPGYKKVKKGSKFSVIFRCSNKEQGCRFSDEETSLPLYVIDDDIYENPPTLIVGTVDKFAMLPFLPQAQSIFGLVNGKRKTAPDLIIQDELHLISGPLGSMVGHYETMINELCSYDKDGVSIQPKVIASTATISRAAEQCNALYACGPEKVKQFPPSGLDAGDSFFAKENRNAEGRRYVGILASGASSNATTMIRLYASLLYAGKEIKVDNESERDGYWTNVGYYNSIRELGQAETWIRADIEEYLHVKYLRSFADKKYSEEVYRKNRRYIWQEQELTSRINGSKISSALQNLGLSYPSEIEGQHPIDICLSTNMISVGVDVPRLGLMTVAGQPKTTAEYIQATSRVGRDKKAPGLVFTVYNPSRPRDKSHYEHFVSYHSRIYCNVEPTSVTPFSSPLRSRALHALFIGILRQEGDSSINKNPPKFPSEEIVERITKVISNRVEKVEPDEAEATRKHLQDILDQWKLTDDYEKYGDFHYTDELPLMIPAGVVPNVEWGNKGFSTPTSMRNVDSTCEARVLSVKYTEEEND